MHKLTHELHKYNPHCFPHCGRITDHCIVTTCEYLLKAPRQAGSLRLGALTQCTPASRGTGPELTPVYENTGESEG